MLVLARRVGQVLTLRHKDTGELIKLTPTRCGSGAARIGIDAAAHWNIVRDEIDEQRVPSLAERSRIQASEADVADLGRRKC